MFVVYSKSGRCKGPERLLIAAARFFFLCAIAAALAEPLAAQEPEYLKGQLLVAAPEMADPHFTDTIVYMIEHNENGAMGLGINRPLAKGPIADLLKGLGAEGEEAKGEIIIHYGVPVESGKAFVLHSDD